MRRGETAKYVQLLTNMGDLYRAFELFSGRLAKQYDPQPRHTYTWGQRCLLSNPAGSPLSQRSCVISRALSACPATLLYLTYRESGDEWKAYSLACTQQIVPALSFRRLCWKVDAAEIFFCRAAALEEKDEHAQMTRERAVYLQRLCTKGLEQLPPSQQLAPPSSLQTVGYACFPCWHLYVSFKMPATHILTALHCCKCEGSARPLSHCHSPRLLV